MKFIEHVMAGNKLAELHVAISTLLCSNSHLSQTPTVICNDCYSRQEEAGFKGRSDCQGSSAVSVHGVCVGLL